ncbi:collagen alpha-5(VI) chain-like [Physella acuta]|uniref:collagen alpha-5(VI) chain-like n=1 Tax=Physella acuta TaxID=109671 RepID=UPI0027DE0260|nr:collagen alpha-5(VI) chain-like [Physella acuta]XP_059147173.1 collagen alpha-5(VI) chain-like [Physella acuta]
MVFKYLALMVLLEIGLCLAFTVPDVHTKKRRETVEDNGDFLLVCQQEPIELGIVLDSSKSILLQDFQTGIKFLQDFLQQFEIGSGPKDVRVSVITYGKGIYAEDAFNLTTYTTKDEVIDAIGNVPHRAGLFTDTGKAIKFMHEVQFAPDIVRPEAQKISIVITDGNSQLWKETKAEAASARNDGIVLFAIGVGKDIRGDELTNIAGDASRVTQVDNYDKLGTIKESLAQKTCIKKEKPTTTPVPYNPPCGEVSPADVYFVFDPATLGLDSTTWATSFISRTLSSQDMDKGFQYGVISGTCPGDAGFDLNDFTNVEDIKTRLQAYDRSKLTDLAQRLLTDGYTEDRGARAGSKKVAVLFAGGDMKKDDDLKTQVDKLKTAGVEVYLADPAGRELTLEGAVTLFGKSSVQAAEDLVGRLCPNLVATS